VEKELFFQVPIRRGKRECEPAKSSADFRDGSADQATSSVGSRPTVVQG
jgi:hypothetical protein